MKTSVQGLTKATVAARSFLVPAVSKYTPPARPLQKVYSLENSHFNKRAPGADGRGYLARTYYAEIEYVLPEPVMQPVWSSVKTADGTVDFGLSYHRAFYSSEYDDYHDIYLQRQEREVPLTGWFLAVSILW